MATTATTVDVTTSGSAAHGQSTEPARLLVVEDYAPLLESLARGLRAAGYAVDASADGEDAEARLARGRYDTVVLDRMLPRGDGLDLVRRLRARGDATPVLLLTAMDAVDERVAGLDAGADDYLTKPFAVPELLARIRRLVRRSAGEATPRDFTLAAGSMSVWCGGEQVLLTPLEYRLLEHLMAHAGAIVPRDDLWRHLYGDAPRESNVLDVLVLRLRKKLRATGRADPIRTRRSLGYLFLPPG